MPIMKSRIALIALAITLLVTVSYRTIFSPLSFSLSDADEEGTTDHRRMTGSSMKAYNGSSEIGKTRAKGKSSKKKSKKYTNVKSNMSSKLRTTSSTSHATPVPRARPIMHTFFTDLTSGRSADHQEPVRSAGMTSEAHSSMLRVWQRSWQQVGWDTRILTMEDAIEHPQFESLRHTIEQVFRMGEYDKARYYRWIAMAAAGGGWMSDYDVLPLYDFASQAYPLPMQGMLVGYEQHVPSLLSGNATEWSRTIQTLVDHASEQTKQSAPDLKTPSDMFSLMSILKSQQQQATTGESSTNDAGYIARSQVLGLHDLPDGVQWTHEQCQITTPTNMRAVHFSHYFVATNWLPNHREHSMDDRPFIASKWLHDWLRDCGGRQTFQELGSVASSEASAT